MKIVLTKEQIYKLLATLSLEDIELKLESNWRAWRVQEVDSGEFEFTKDIKELKNE